MIQGKAMGLTREEGKRMVSNLQDEKLIPGN